MNIFYLDADPQKAASFMCDKHVVKMATEYAQILSTVHHAMGTGNDSLYKPTHTKHPSVLWACESVANYRWLYAHWRATLSEYTRRYGRQHASGRLKLALAIIPSMLPERTFSNPPQVMPEIYQQEDTVEAYRLYYREEKSSFAKWKLGGMPLWMNKFDKAISA